MIHALGYHYFWFCVLLLCGSAITRWVVFLRGSDHFSLREALVSTLFLPILVPYYGLLASKAIWAPLAWQLFAVFVVFESVRWYFLPKTRDIYRQLGLGKSLVVFGVITLISLPPLVAAVQYAFFSVSLFAVD